MRRKLIAALTIFALILIAVSLFALAGSSSESKVKSSNIFTNFWNALNPFSYSGAQEQNSSADIYGWYTGANFGLIEAERDICVTKLRTDVITSRSVEDSGDDTRFYTTTATASARKLGGFNGTHIFEASWYIRPFDTDAKYKVYFSKGQSKKYIVGKDGSDESSWEKVSKLSGDNGYYAEYLSEDFDNIFLEYVLDGMTEPIKFKAPVVK